MSSAAGSLPVQAVEFLMPRERLWFQIPLCRNVRPEIAVRIDTAHHNGGIPIMLRLAYVRGQVLDVQSDAALVASVRRGRM